MFGQIMNRMLSSPLSSLLRTNTTVGKLKCFFIDNVVNRFEKINTEPQTLFSTFFKRVCRNTVHMSSF